MNSQRDTESFRVIRDGAIKSVKGVIILDSHNQLCIGQR